ncbi:uncharacterized protein LOC144880975 [Branchiostoma floridae x Branchiostoma japonicum]
MAGTGLATVTLKVINDLDPKFQPYQAFMSVPPRSSVYTLLLQASADDPDFTFQAEYYDSLSSHNITSINGVTASVKDETYWSFENKEKEKFDRGVDLIGVFDGDVIVFCFKHYSDERPRRPVHPIGPRLPWPIPPGPAIPPGRGPVRKSPFDAFFR